MKILKSILTLFLIIGIVSCGDNGAGVDQDPPEIPDLKNVQPETEFFDSSSSKVTSAKGSNYDTAKQFVETVVDPLFSLGESIAFPMIDQAKNQDPEFQDGKWVWTFNSTQQGITIEVKITANVDESSGEINWELFLTSSGTEGFGFNEYKFMGGTSSVDGSDGSWKIFPFNPDGSSQAVIEFNWIRQDQNNLTNTFTVNDQSSGETFTIDYEESGVEHSLNIKSSSGTVNVEIFWNSDTNQGYIIQSGQKLCWDSDLNNTTCS